MGCLVRGAHPRVCGENSLIRRRRVSLVGSSPRVRGKPCAFITVAAGDGLIPACAGKTHLGFLLLRAWWAHPRVCGENRPGRPGRPGRNGSSPRVRGKPIQDFSDLFQRGLIPACAGKTGLRLANRRFSGAHPRVCGENVSATLRVRFGAGSSPRVRGKPSMTQQRDCSPGLIPACAGKTRVASGVRVRRRAHPRVCGENIGSPTVRLS